MSGSTVLVAFFGCRACARPDPGHGDSGEFVTDHRGGPLTEVSGPLLSCPQIPLQIESTLSQVVAHVSRIHAKGQLFVDLGQAGEQLCGPDEHLG